MKKHIRIIIDIVMFVLLIILMGYHITNNKIHEILGIITFVLFIIHHILNIRWYKNLFKGKYNFQRTFSLIVDGLLFLAMIGIMISSVMISSTVFDFLNLKTSTFGRELHLVATAWCFVLIAIHLGLHLNVLVYKLKKKLKTSSFEYVVYLLLILVMLYGLYSFITNRLWEDMFLITEFKFFDYDEHPLVFYSEYLAISIFLMAVIYFTCSLVRKHKKK